MRVVRNIGYVNKQRKVGKISAILGFLMLLGSFPAAFILNQNPNFVFLTYGILVLGFILFNRGMRALGRWTNSPRHQREDLALDGALTNFGDRYTMVHYGQPEKDVLDHVLVHPAGLLVVTARDFPNDAKVTGSTWRKSGAIFGRLFQFGGPQLGNPTADTLRTQANLAKVLAANEMTYDIQGVIAFTAPTATVEAIDPDVPVVAVEDLGDFVRQLGGDLPAMKPAERDAVVAAIGVGAELEAPVAPKTRRPVKVKRPAA